MLPTNIDIDNARLPARYEQAKIALSACDQIDECQTFTDKAEALAGLAERDQRVHPQAAREHYEACSQYRRQSATL
jgi:hypothetical protein